MRERDRERGRDDDDEEEEEGVICVLQVHFLRLGCWLVPNQMHETFYFTFFFSIYKMY